MLLLETKTELQHTVKLTLSYDDNITKEIIITDGSFMILKYRYNGNKNIDVVKVNKVKAKFNPLTPTKVIFDGAILVLDIAKEFNSKRIQIDTDDILNAKVITEESAMDFLEHWDTVDKSDQIFEPDATKDDNEDIDSGFGIDDESEEPTDPNPDEGDHSDNKGDNTETGDNNEKENTGSGEESNSQPSEDSTDKSSDDENHTDSES